MKHDCGCITKRIEGKLVVWACNLHGENGNNKWIWIALQHEDK